MVMVGRLCVFVALLIHFSGFSQCATVKDLFDAYDDSRVNEDHFNSEGMVSNFPFLNYSFDFPLYSYAGKETSDHIYLRSGDIMVYSTQNVSCFKKIKAMVAKEVGLKVAPKVLSSKNNVSIESYQHTSRDLTIEFHQLGENKGFNVVIISAARSANFNEQIVAYEQRLQAEKRVSEKIDQARTSMTAKNYDKSESYLNEAKRMLRDANVSSTVNEMVSSFENELNATRFQDASSEIYKSIGLKRFIEARNRLLALQTKSQANSSKVLSIERELNSKAVSFYLSKFTESKNAKLYSAAVLYADSLLMFEPGNTQATSGKKEMISIISFLKERKTTQFDYWKYNPQLKNTLSDVFKQKTLGLIDGSSGGSYSFDLLIETDTSCGVYPSIRWTSLPSENIVFGNEAISSYGIGPIEKYGYCAKALGTLSFNLSFSNTKFKTTYLQGDYRGNTMPDQEVSNFLESKFGNVRGKLSYVVSDVQFNAEQTREIYITNFHTRGPQNALYSLLMPGLGSMIVTYGKKGYVPMLLWMGGLASVYYGTGNVATVGALAVTTSYFWDFIATLVRGSKNLNVSKSLRMQLRGDNSVKL
jgi:hypothetical protein